MLKAAPSTELVVRLTPSTLIEPLRAMYLARFSGARISSRRLSPTGSKRSTSPTPSTWPETRCPPRRSARRSAFSRLTGPGAARPTVHASDSGETSTKKQLSCLSTTVRQTPLQAIESPIPTSSSPSGPASTVSRTVAAPSSRGVMWVIWPTAAMIPENMANTDRTEKRWEILTCRTAPVPAPACGRALRGHRSVSNPLPLPFRSAAR
ncbi:MAG: hypothetical protein AW09_003777 [Candidatus Accumulibacter phosphatis]|uniref:Uncharacterized protein n=1 Tax=Candidatus Accumulibacter phosphatis TaxID=327160 RepID=A0A080LS25_9PROT|nr:MAG: hypothetical protein AW09_003777 [Candidatus Accumulibacter phosphatis]